MNNRELLDLAAEAAGLQGGYYFSAGGKHGNGFPYDIEGFRLTGGAIWNPLTDDGNALRLAVNLRMRIHHDGYYAFVEIPTGQKYCWMTSATVEGNDHYAAMRYAIVRAAAEIGKGANHDN